MSGSRRAGLLLALGLALRLGYVWHSQRKAYIPSDNDNYETVALSVLERGEYAIVPGKPTAMREPGYPFLIAGVYALAGGRSPGVLLVVQCLLSLISAWLIYRLGLRLFSLGVAEAALAVCLFYPQHVYYCAYFYRETFLAFLLSSLAYASSFWPGARAARAVGAGGLCAGAMVITNFATLPAALLTGAGLWAVSPRESRLRRAALYLAPMLLICGIWTTRNLRVLGALVPGNTHGGEEFYQALIVPPADLGTSRQWEILRDDRVYQASHGLPEVQRNAVLMRESMRIIARRPFLYMSRVAARIVKFWRLWPYKRDYHHSYLVLFVVSLVSDAWIVPLGLWGLWTFRYRWREAPAVWAGIAGLTLVYGAVHAVIRYRLPLMGCVCLLAAAQIGRLVMRNAE